MTEESKRNKKSSTEINSSKTPSKLNPKKKTIKKILKPETIKHNLHKKKKLRSLKDLFQLRRQNMLKNKVKRSIESRHNSLTESKLLLSLTSNNSKMKFMSEKKTHRSISKGPNSTLKTMSLS